MDCSFQLDMETADVWCSPICSVKRSKKLSHSSNLQSGLALLLKLSS